MHNFEWALIPLTSLCCEGSLQIAGLLSPTTCLISEFNEKYRAAQLYKQERGSSISAYRQYQTVSCDLLQLNRGRPRSCRSLVPRRSVFRPVHANHLAARICRLFYIGQLTISSFTRKNCIIHKCLYYKKDIVLYCDEFEPSHPKLIHV